MLRRSAGASGSRLPKTRPTQRCSAVARRPAFHVQLARNCRSSVGGPSPQRNLGFSVLIGTCLIRPELARHGKMYSYFARRRQPRQLLSLQRRSPLRSRHEQGREGRGMANGMPFSSKGPNYAKLSRPTLLLFFLPFSGVTVGGSNSSQRLYNPSRVKSFGSVGRPVPTPGSGPEREKLLLSALAHGH